MQSILAQRDQLADHLTNLLEAMPAPERLSQMRTLKARFQADGLTLDADEPMQFAADLMSQISPSEQSAEIALKARTPEQIADALT